MQLADRFSELDQNSIEVNIDHWSWSLAFFLYSLLLHQPQQVHIIGLQTAIQTKSGLKSEYTIYVNYMFHISCIFIRV